MGRRIWKGWGKAMLITAENLKKIKTNNLVSLWNIFTMEEEGRTIFPMDGFNEACCHYKPSELLGIIGAFDIHDECFYYDVNGMFLLSNSYSKAVAAVVDFEALAKDINRDVYRYKDEIECDEFAEILFYSTELDSVEWEELMVCYTPMEIETVRNAKITKAEAQALKELKEYNAQFNQHDYDEDIDYLLTYCRTED